MDDDDDGWWTTTTDVGGQPVHLALLSVIGSGELTNSIYERINDLS